MQDWYAPLEERTSPESEKKKRKPGKTSWRIGGAILLVVLLIAASSLIFSGSNQRTEAPYIGGDGMPDEWEIANGLNPNDPSDANGDCTGDGYTNIEKYINGISTKVKVDWTDLKNNHDTLAGKTKLF